MFRYPSARFVRSAMDKCNKTGEVHFQLACAILSHDLISNRIITRLKTHRIKTTRRNHSLQSPHLLLEELAPSSPFEMSPKKNVGDRGVSGGDIKR